MSSRLKLSLFDQSVSKQRIRTVTASHCMPKMLEISGKFWEISGIWRRVEDRCTTVYQCNFGSETKMENWWRQVSNGDTTDIDRCPLCVRNDPIHSCHSYKSSLDSQFSAIAYYNFIQFNIQRFIVRKKRLFNLPYVHIGSLMFNELSTSGWNHLYFSLSYLRIAASKRLQLLSFASLTAADTVSPLPLAAT